MKNIVSYGGGVNSTALIIEMVRRGMPIDVVIFADTGVELPETYEFIKTFRNWLISHKLMLYITAAKFRTFPEGISLEDYYAIKKTIPMRRFRDCTDKFKLRPIMKLVKVWKEEGITKYLGIAYDERKRVRESTVKWVRYSYPLVDWRITREGCVNLIKSEGLPVPVKSGCFLCPFQPVEAWHRLYTEHRELWERAKKLEVNNRSYPRMALPWKGTLADLEKSFEVGVVPDPVFKPCDASGAVTCGGLCDT